MEHMKSELSFSSSGMYSGPLPLHSRGDARGAEEAAALELEGAALFLLGRGGIGCVAVSPSTPDTPLRLVDAVAVAVAEDEDKPRELDAFDLFISSCKSIRTSSYRSRRVTFNIN